MKLVHPRIEVDFDFEKQPLQQLIIENAREYYKLTTELFIQCTQDADGGDWVLSNASIRNLEKESLLIYDYYSFDLNSKKITNLLNAEIIKILTKYDYLQEILSLSAMLNTLNTKMLDEIDLPIEYNQQLSFEDIVKVSKYQIASEITLSNKILTYVDIFIKLKQIKVVIFLNITAVFETEELNILLKELLYKGIKILCIDGFYKKIPAAKQTIIDDDLCII